MFRETGIAVVGEAIRHPVQDPDRPVDLAKQQHSGVRRDRSAVERGRYPAALAPLKCEGKRFTLCRHRSSGVVAVKLFSHIKLNSSRRPVPSYAFEKSGLDVSSVVFRHCTFTGATISGTKFEESDLRETYWAGEFGGNDQTSMQEANMCGIRASSCVFRDI